MKLRTLCYWRDGYIPFFRSHHRPKSQVFRPKGLQFFAQLWEKLQLRNGSNRRSTIPVLMIGQLTTIFFYSLWKDFSKLTQQYYTEPLAGVEGLNSGAILILRDSLKLPQTPSKRILKEPTFFATTRWWRGHIATVRYRLVLQPQIRSPYWMYPSRNHTRRSCGEFILSRNKGLSA